MKIAIQLLLIASSVNFGHAEFKPDKRLDTASHKNLSEIQYFQKSPILQKLQMLSQKFTPNHISESIFNFEVKFTLTEDLKEHFVAIFALYTIPANKEILGGKFKKVLDDGISVYIIAFQTDLRASAEYEVAYIKVNEKTKELIIHSEM
jgi:hypothetical protein